MVLEIQTMEDLTSALTEAGDKLVVIDFYANWCGPCKKIGPMIETVSKSMDDVVFLKVNVDDSEDVANEYNISDMPTFVFIKNSEKVDDMTGADFDQLKEKIESLRG